MILIGRGLEELYEYIWRLDYWLANVQNTDKSENTLRNRASLVNNESRDLEKRGFQVDPNIQRALHG